MEAAATEMRRLCRSSWRRHCIPRYASQYWQSYSQISSWIPRPACIGCAYGGSASHGPQQAVVDLDDLLHRLARYPVACRSPGVCSHDDAPLESECQRRRAVGDLDGAVRVGVVVGHCAQPGRGLSRLLLASRPGEASDGPGPERCAYLGYWRHREFEGELRGCLEELLLLRLRRPFLSVGWTGVPGD